MCSTKGVSTSTIHKHKAENVIEQMVMNTEGLMDKDYTIDDLSRTLL